MGKALSFAQAKNFKKIILDTTDQAIKYVAKKAGFKKFKQEGNFVYYEKTLNLRE